MKKREEEQSQPQDQDLELLKAVAQAWHSQVGNPKPTKEYDARKSSCYKSRPSRFKLEAMSLVSREAAGAGHWDFGQSLWDSYEIITLLKKLEESNLALDIPVSSLPLRKSVGKKIRESKNSLRNLLSGDSSFQEM